MTKTCKFKDLRIGCPFVYPHNQDMVFEKVTKDTVHKASRAHDDPAVRNTLRTVDPDVEILAYDFFVETD